MPARPGPDMTSLVSPHRQASVLTVNQNPPKLTIAGGLCYSAVTARGEGHGWVGAETRWQPRRCRSALCSVSPCTVPGPGWLAGWLAPRPWVPFLDAAFCEYLILLSIRGPSGDHNPMMHEDSMMPVVREARGPLSHAPQPSHSHPGPSDPSCPSVSQEPAAVTLRLSQIWRRP